jgi:predicted transcriptional regulator
MRPFISFQHLGPLEQQMLEDVWTRGNATARELTDASDRYAYSTVMTTLDRLFKKGLLTREVEGRNRRYRYSARLTRNELQRVVATQLIRDVLDRAGSSYTPVLSHFVDLVADFNPTLLDELQRSIDEQRNRRAA